MDEEQKSNPAVLGLLGYGMTTVLLSLSNAGVFELGTMILSMAIFFGGIAQAIVALMSFRKGDTFGLTAFGGYAFLWLSLAFLMIGENAGWAAVANSGTAMGWYLFIWAIFSFMLMIGSVKVSYVLNIVLNLTWILLVILAVGYWTGSSTLITLGGWEGVLTGASAIYLAFAFLYNELFGRSVLWVGIPGMRRVQAPPTGVKSR